jgi:hypothetical protein
MLLLQSAWGVDGQKKRTLIIGGMPALMHGILKPIAMFLAGLYPEFGYHAQKNYYLRFYYYYYKKLPFLLTQTQEPPLAIMNSLVSLIRNSNCKQLLKQLLKPSHIATN